MANEDAQTPKPAKKKIPRSPAGRKPAAKKPAVPVKPKTLKNGKPDHRAKPKGKTQAAKDAAIPSPEGRPTMFDEAMADKVLEHLATGGAMRTFMEMDGYPYPCTVYRWLFRYPKFRDNYLEARNIGMFAMGEDMFDIADDGANDYMEKLDKDGQAAGWRENGETVQRSRLRVQTRQWYMERMNARHFGDKKQVKHEVDEDSVLSGILKSVSGATLRPKPQSKRED